MNEYRNFDMTLILRRGVIHFGVIISAFGMYVAFFSGICLVIGLHSLFSGMLASLATILTLTVLYRKLYGILENISGKLVYSTPPFYRDLILDFSATLNNIIDLNEIAESTMRLVIQIFHCKHVSIMFYGHGEYYRRFSQQLSGEEKVQSFVLPDDSAIVSRLKQNSRPITGKELHSDPLLAAEVNNIESGTEIELLCPVQFKQKLVAIMVLTGKYPRGKYSASDLNTLTTLSNKVGVTIHNARLYSHTTEGANVDEMTGLFNQRLFDQRLDEEISRCSRYGQYFSLAVIDVDNFKHFNDVSGHVAGNETLKVFGQMIKCNKRDIDLGFRYGGDEFAIIYPQTGAEDAMVAADRLRRYIETRMDLPDRQFTISIGIASWPGDGVMREEIIKAADTALYYAKQTGKNRVVLASRISLDGIIRSSHETNSENLQNYLSTIYALAATVDAKDHYTYGHSKKVSRYAADLAVSLGYDSDGVERIRAAALLHDIGKIGIADKVLKKSEPLTPVEFELIKAHPELGAAIIKHVEQLDGCLAAIRYHHEYFNGSGYPCGLKGDAIPLDARILAVADAFDAMTSERPYRKKKTLNIALAELKKCAGSQFDPEIVKVFVDMLSDRKTVDMEYGN